MGALGLFAIFVTLFFVALILHDILNVLKRVASALEKLAQKTEESDTQEKG